MIIKYLFILCLTLLSSCQIFYPKLQGDGVGLWKHKSDEIDALILRKADGTMRRKEFRNFDYAKVPKLYVSHYQWNVDRKHYHLTLQYDSSGEWEKDIGKKWDLKVLSLDKDFFRYLSSDNATMDEIRIGPASDAAFDAMHVGPGSEAQ